MISVGFSTTRSLLSRIIRKATMSKVSHTFISFDVPALGGRFMMDADWDGFRLRPHNHIFKSSAVVFEMKPKHDVSKLPAACAEFMDSPYDLVGLFGVTVVKVLLVDTSTLSQIYRILAFFALAVILGLAWLAYQRIRIDSGTEEIEESDAHASNDS